MFPEREVSCTHGTTEVEIRVISGVTHGRRKCLDMPEGQRAPPWPETPQGSRTGGSSQAKQFCCHR